MIYTEKIKKALVVSSYFFHIEFIYWNEGNTMNELVYKKYIQGQITKSEDDDSLLLFANEMVLLKDKKHIDLFWDKDEEKLVRAYIEESKRISLN
jgi:hypothetical protein